MLERLSVAIGAQASRKGLHNLNAGLSSVAVRRRGLLLLRVAAIAAALAGFIDFVLSPLQGHFAGEFEDYQDYLAAARAVAKHTDIYASFVNHIQPIPVQGFDYPPVVAWLLQPLAVLPTTLAAKGWLLFLLACTVAGTAIIAFELLPAAWPRLELTAIFALVYAPATYNLWHGQMSAVVFLLLALALRSWLRGEQFSLGVYVGIAALIKIAPVLLIVLFIRRRWWAACLSLALTIVVGVGAGLLALGVGTLREYMTRVLPVLAQQNGWVYNQSAAGAINRMAAHSVLAFQPSSVVITILTVVIAVGAVGAAGSIVQPTATSRSIRGGEFAVGILAMLLAGSVTWFWHLGTLLIVVAAIPALVAGRAIPRPRLVVIATVGVLAATGVVAPLLIDTASMTGLIAVSRTWLWWPLLQLISTPVFAIAALFVTLVFALHRQSRPYVPNFDSERARAAGLLQSAGP